MIILNNMMGNLKIFTAVLTAISSGFALVPHPIAKGIGIAVGLASAITGMSCSIEETKSR